jgi:hypothetical protein
LSAPLPAGGQIVTPDTIRAIPPRTRPTPEDSAAVAPSKIRVVGPGARAAAPDTARKLPWHDQPRFVMARSLIIPGWGQLHNRSWLKAGLVAAAETWLGVQIVRDTRRLDDLLGEIEALRANPDTTTLSERRQRDAVLVSEYNTLLDQRLARQWFFGGVLAYALVDAYVDAHFRGFDIEFQNDPALPPGSRPATPADRGTRFGLRVALRREF